MHMLDVVLLLLATTVIALLFWELHRCNIGAYAQVFLLFVLRSGVMRWGDLVSSPLRSRLLSARAAMLLPSPQALLPSTLLALRVSASGGVKCKGVVRSKQKGLWGPNR